MQEEYFLLWFRKPVKAIIGCLLICFNAIDLTFKLAGCFFRFQCPNAICLFFFLNPVGQGDMAIGDAVWLLFCAIGGLVFLLLNEIPCQRSDSLLLEICLRCSFPAGLSTTMFPELLKTWRWVRDKGFQVWGGITHTRSVI